MDGYTTYGVVQKLKAIKKPMRRLNWKNGDLTERVKLRRGKLMNMQKEMVQNPHDKSIKVKEAECLAEYLIALNDEENFFFQKAKVDWIRETFKGSLIADQFVQHFQRFLGPNEKVNAMNTQNLFKNKLSEEEDLNMVADINDKEIKEAIIKKGLNKLVNVNQSTFVPRRVIQDNLMITQELLKGYNCKNRPSRCALKIDIAKVYDIVNSDFLRNVLVKFGFHGNMVNWIMTCVCLAAFTIGINGKIFGYFKSGKGLRQVDPISPYIFTLIMVVFSLMLARKVIEEEAGDSGTWKALLELRNKVRPYIFHQIGNGEDVFVTPPDGAWTKYVSEGVILLRISSTKHKQQPLRKQDGKCSQESIVFDALKVNRKSIIKLCWYGCLQLGASVLSEKS
uniref:Reverse transcriptase domain, reverse transcriptase zinc-binding domain protein n=1 Tax=Tanacetum cinerariifolium TaxID=118510 RepID=A0A6L2LHD3_TANCI|nr:reverse transcriptase domain, reverse transcriptase zinc-binding domain protein [Tanacetum cinerariifolium]